MGMSEIVRIHNPLGQPIIYTARGHQLDGYSGVHADPSEPVTARLLEQGRILIASVAPPPPVISRPTPPKKKPAPGKEEA